MLLHLLHAASERNCYRYINEDTTKYKEKACDICKDITQLINPLSIFEFEGFEFESR